MSISFKKENLKVREVEGLAQDHVASKWTMSGHCLPISSRRKEVGRDQSWARKAPLHLARCLPGGDAGQMAACWERGRVLEPSSLLPVLLAHSCYPDPDLSA